MNFNKTKKMVIAALFSAIIFTATFFIQFKLPHGYINLGDAAVLLCGRFLGPLYGGIAAAMGSLLADILSGYVLYAPITFITKGIMAVCSYYIFSSIKNRSHFIATFFSGLIAEIIMISFYFIFEVFVIGFAAAFLNIYANAIQAAFGLILYIIIVNFLPKKLFKL